MGTKYHVNVITSDPHAPEGLQAAVERRLAQVNRHLSTWIEDSEISRFNRFHEVGAEFPISEDFRRVMTAARETYIASAGAWDATVGPLVDLWGFGPAGPPPSAPSAEQIAAAMALVGFNHIEIRAGSLVKQRSAATLDLSSIAKGYGVDAVVELLHGEGFSDFLVEIGGEVYAVGAHRDGRPWRVGVEWPEPDVDHDELYQAVHLDGRALATSGDYRSFFVDRGRRRSHVIDPRSGKPVANGVVSVSVLAPTCMQADALATALMVMGPESGLSLVERLEGVEALIVVEKQGGLLKEHASSGFPAKSRSK